MPMHMPMPRRLAEAEAQAKGGFGSAANYALGELTPEGYAAPPPASDLPMPPPRPPSGSSRRSTPTGGRLDPLAPSVPSS